MLSAYSGKYLLPYGQLKHSCRGETSSAVRDVFFYLFFNVLACAPHTHWQRNDVGAFAGSLPNQLSRPLKVRGLILSYSQLNESNTELANACRVYLGALLHSTHVAWYTCNLHAAAIVFIAWSRALCSHNYSYIPLVDTC